MIPNPQTVHNWHVNGALFEKMTKCFLHRHNLTIRSYLQSISNLWNHSGYTEIGDFTVH